MKVFFSNCGTCLEASNHVRNPDSDQDILRFFTSVESPTSSVIGDASGEVLICDIRENRIGREFINDWTFRVSTLEESTCEADKVFFTFRKTAEEDACIPEP